MAHGRGLQGRQDSVKNGRVYAFWPSVCAGARREAAVVCLAPHTRVPRISTEASGSVRRVPKCSGAGRHGVAERRPQLAAHSAPPSGADHDDVVLPVGDPHERLLGQTPGDERLPGSPKPVLPDTARAALSSRSQSSARAATVVDLRAAPRLAAPRPAPATARCPGAGVVSGPVQSGEPSRRAAHCHDGASGRDIDVDAVCGGVGQWTHSTSCGCLSGPGPGGAGPARRPGAPGRRLPAPGPPPHPRPAGRCPSCRRSTHCPDPPVRYMRTSEAVGRPAGWVCASSTRAGARGAGRVRSRRSRPSSVSGPGRPARGSGPGRRPAGAWRRRTSRSGDGWSAP